jgi:hypothetical protein
MSDDLLSDDTRGLEGYWSRVLNQSSIRKSLYSELIDAVVAGEFTYKNIDEVCIRPLPEFVAELQHLFKARGFRITDRAIRRQFSPLVEHSVNHCFNVRQRLLAQQVSDLIKVEGYPYKPLLEQINAFSQNLWQELIDAEFLVPNLVEDDRFREVITLRGKGRTLEEVGSVLGVTRERVRQIQNLYPKHLLQLRRSDKELIELFEEVLAQHTGDQSLPNTEIVNKHNSKIIGCLYRLYRANSNRELFPQFKDRDWQSFRAAYFPEVDEYSPKKRKWTREMAISQIRQIAEELGQPTLMPKQVEISKRDQALRGYILTEFGGQSKAAAAAGLIYQGQTVGDSGRTYWTDERIKAFLHDVAEQEGHPGVMPSQRSVTEYGKKDYSASLVSIFTKAFTDKYPTRTWFEVAQEVGLKIARGDPKTKITIGFIRDFVRSLGEVIHNLTPAELYKIFEQQGISDGHAQSRVSDNLVGALQSGYLPRVELDQFLNGKDSELVDQLLNPENKTVKDAFKKTGRKYEKTATTNSKKSDLSENRGTREVLRLPSINSHDSLSALDTVTDIINSTSGDQEAIDFFVAKATDKLWKHCFIDESTAVEQARSYRGNVYSEEVKSRFLREYDAAKILPEPLGYSFVDLNGVRRSPKLMQKLVATRLASERKLMNLSGTGTGKTLSAVLASRIIDARVTVIACPNITVEKGWADTIRRTFKDSEIATKTWAPNWSSDNPRYLVNNHDMFRDTNEALIKGFINENPIDLVVIDEIHQVKKRDEATESQRHRLMKGLISDIPPGREPPAVLGMSATPVINNLREGRSLIELVSREEHNEIEDAPNLQNCMKVYQQFTLMGLRMMPEPLIDRTPITYDIDASAYLEELLQLGRKPHPQAVDAVLLQAKLPTIIDCIRAKTVVLTEYKTDIVVPLARKIKEAGYSVGIYTGDDKAATEIDYDSSLDQFIAGNTDVLIATIQTVGTGVDGLQQICNNVVFATLPWTSAAYEQAIGRFDREGFNFDTLDIHLPQTRVDLNSGGKWSWCDNRWERIVHKRDIASAAVDGEIPDSGSQLTPQKATQYLMNWLERLNEFGLRENVTRKKIVVPLDETNVVEVQRRQATYGDFSKLNNLWNRAHSSTTHERLNDDPEEWMFYHTRLIEQEEGWEIIPREHVVDHLRQNLPAGSAVADFGCGRALLAEELDGLHIVHSFDHIGKDSDVIACDMMNTPLPDEVANAVVFSLSLMGSNIKDYISEAYRVLQPNGQLLIYHPAIGNDRVKFLDGLTQYGFRITEEGQLWKWHYIWATRLGSQQNLDVDINF